MFIHLTAISLDINPFPHSEPYKPSLPNSLTGSKSKITVPSLLLLTKRLYHNEQETSSITRWNPALAGSDGEALDLPARSRFGEGRAETFYRPATGVQVHEEITIARRSITHNSQ
jgi:hypothetical protein